MKVTDLTDNMLSKDRYESFKAEMEGCEVTFTATELPLGSNTIELRKCRVVYDPSLEFVIHGSPPKKDSEADWQHVLDRCKHFGFDPR